MNELMAIKRVSSFEKLLIAYEKAGMLLNDAIDGGAASGSATRQMLEHMGVENKVYAFEPFPGNHRFFRPEEERIVLIPKALAEQEKLMTFRVSSVVQEDSEWGKRGMAGYSSVGRLVAGSPAKGVDLEVECVSGDKAIPLSANIGFIKLDLQGGELNALHGMARLLRDTHLMWVEYSGQPGLMDFLIESNYVIFDTEYFFMGSPTEKATAAFDISRENFVLSTGKMAWFGFKNRPWKSFEAEFIAYKKELSMIQTDLVCVNRCYIDEFIAAIRYL